MQYQILYLFHSHEDKILFESLIENLGQFECNTFYANTESDAIRILVSENVDITFVDNNMASTSGSSFVSSIRNIGCQVPMVVLTDENHYLEANISPNHDSCQFLRKSNLSGKVLERTILFCVMNDATAIGTDSGDNDRADDPESSVVFFPSTILIIDDDEDDFLITKELVTEVYGRRCNLVWASDFENGQNLALNGTFDAILVDYHLEGRSGLELIKTCIRLGAQSPFIILTGEDNRQKDMAALHAGATDYLVKSEISPVLIDRSIRYSMERFRSEARLAELAKFDQLTGLANRHLFHDFLSCECERCKHDSTLVALLLIDLDRFKQLNDTHGHGAGDSLLREIARRLKREIRASDLVARLGGDEFTVVLTEITSEKEAYDKASAIHKAICKPFSISGRKVEPCASIGISIYPNDAGTIDELIASADTAMYAAKRQQFEHIGKYTPDLRSRTTRRLHLERTMQFAIEASQFQLYYQPKFDMRINRVTGFEALLRWRHPELGEISPGEFVQMRGRQWRHICHWRLGSRCRVCATRRMAGNGHGRLFGRYKYLRQANRRQDIMPQNIGSHCLV